MFTEALSYPASDLPRDPSPRRLVHALAWLTALTVFPLIWMGGLVTSHGVGMSVPDWPNTFGYNMFAVPWAKWLTADAGGVFYEHSHRLLGTMAGLVTIALAAHAYGAARSPKWRKRFGWAAISLGVFSAMAMIANLTTDSQRVSVMLGHISSLGMLAVLFGILWSARRSRHPSLALRRLAITLLIAIIVQGLMGGFRVTEVSLWLAFFHGVFGQLVFALAAVAIVLSSQWWTKANMPKSARSAGPVRWLTVSAALVCLLVMTQLVLGATMRHDVRRGKDNGGPGLAIPDWPLHYGHLLPPVSGEGIDKINTLRAFQLDLPPVARSDVWLHFTHRSGAYLTACAIAGLIVLAWQKGTAGLGLRLPATLVGILVTCQITLGVLTVLYLKPADVATAHQAGGALLLAMSAAMLCRSARILYLDRLAVASRITAIHSEKLEPVGAVG